MLQLKAILNQLEMNLKNSEQRFQVAPHKKQKQKRRERRRGRKSGRVGNWQVVFSHAARTSQMSAHHFDEPTRSSAKEVIKKKKENTTNT